MQLAKQRMGPALALLGAALALPLVLAAVFAAPRALDWNDALATAVQGWEQDGWRVLRGGIKWIVPPAVTLAVVWALAQLVSRGHRRSASVALLLGAGAFLTIEGIKLGYLPFPGDGVGGLRDMSGHVAMTGSAFIVAVITLPTAHRRLWTAVAWVLLVGLCLAVIASRWHDTGDVVVALGIHIGWVLGALAVAIAGGLPTGRPPSSHEQAAWRSLVVAASGAALIAAVLVGLGHAAKGVSPIPTLAATALAIVSVTIVLALATLRLAAAVDGWQGAHARSAPPQA